MHANECVDIVRICILSIPTLPTWLLSASHLAGSFMMVSFSLISCSFFKLHAGVDHKV